MWHAFTRWSLASQDWFRNSPTVRNLFGRYKLWTDHWHKTGDNQELARSLARLCAAVRHLQDPGRVRQVQAVIRDRVAQLDYRQVDWREFVPDVDEPEVPRGIILKPWIGPREKGVIYVGFEVEWIKFLLQPNVAEFAQRYTLIVAPTSNPHNLINYVMPAKYPSPLFTTINHDEDVTVLADVSPNYRVLPFFTSHWVDPEAFQPLPRSERDLDLVMVAAWGKVKRHHHFFQALRALPSELRVLLIGQDQEGRTAETIRHEARAYGVADRFETWSNAPHAQVVAALCRAKTSILLSRREGSAVVVPEALFADTPMGLLANCANGSKAFINPQTGRFLHDRQLGIQLVDFVRHAEDYSPRAWALANISCWQSTNKLNDLLKQYAAADSQEWTRDILPMCWRPNPTLARPEDQRQLESERQDIWRRYGVLVGQQST